MGEAKTSKQTKLQHNKCIEAVRKYASVEKLSTTACYNFKYKTSRQTIVGLENVFNTTSAKQFYVFQDVFKTS